MWDTLEQIAPAIVITILVLVTLYNGHESQTGKASIAVLWCTIPIYFVYGSESNYTWMVDVFGIYGVESLTPLLAICTLSFIRCKLSTILMCLFSMLILANCWLWWLEGFGHEIYEAQQSIVWGVFILEVALMLSKRLTNGLHGGIFVGRLAANLPAHWVARINSNIRPNSNLGSH